MPILLKSPFVILFLCFVLNGCSNSEDQRKLQNEVSETKKMVASEQRNQSKADFVLPKPVTFGDVQSNTNNSSTAATSENPLENYSLKALRFVGTLSQDNQTWAYIMTPDNMLYQVRPGDTLGSEHGRVAKIETDHIEVSMPSNPTGNDKSEKIISLQLKE